MRRLLHLTLLGLSLLLGAAVAGMWVRSYGSADYVYYTIPEEYRSGAPVTRESQSFGVLQRRGVLQLEWLSNASVHALVQYVQVNGQRVRWPSGYAGRWSWGTGDLTASDAVVTLKRMASERFRGGIGWREPTSSFLQFGYANLVYPAGFYPPGSAPGICRLLTVPHWAAILPTLVYPLLALSRVRRRRGRKTRGLCLDCGYDLRATPARCPECGRMAAAPARQP